MNVSGAVCCSQGGVNVFEGVVCWFVSAAAFAPSLNDSLVVSEYLEMNIGGAGMEDGKNEEFESNTFCPSDVAVSSVPVWTEYPSTPSAIEENANTCGGASI